MTLDERIQGLRLRVMQRAEQIGNVSQSARNSGSPGRCSIGGGGASEHGQTRPPCGEADAAEDPLDRAGGHVKLPGAVQGGRAAPAELRDGAGAPAKWRWRPSDWCRAWRSAPGYGAVAGSPAAGAHHRHPGAVIASTPLRVWTFWTAPARAFSHF
jgi:hypothetical protein